MAIWKVSIRIPDPNDYYENFVQELFLECELPPTKDQILKVLETLHLRDIEYDEYTFEWQDCIDAVDECKEFPDFYRDDMVERTSDGIGIMKINPIKI